MITAIVLINADVDRIPEVAQAIAEQLDGVREVYSVTGDSDLIALVQVEQHDDFADVIADRLNKIAGGAAGRRRTSRSGTYVVASDLEAAFSIGLRLILADFDRRAVVRAR